MRPVPLRRHRGGLLGGVENAGQPVRRQRIPGLENHRIEAAGTPGMMAAGARQPEAGGPTQSGALGRRDTGRRAAEAGVAALTHLNEGQRAAVEHDQVDLASLAGHVAGDDAAAPGLQVARRCGLGSVGHDLPTAAAGAHNATALFPQPPADEIQSLQHAVIVCGGDPPW